jgi:hypothetical protein
MLSEAEDQQSTPDSKILTNASDFAQLRGDRFCAASFVEHY